MGVTIKLRVGVDLDGVCYDFNGVYKSYLLNKQRLTAEQMIQDDANWHFYREWGMSDEEFMEHFLEGVNKRIIFAGPAYNGTREGLQAIIDMGHDIHIITDRSIGNPGVAAAVTYEFIDQELPKPIKAVTFTADKTVANVDIMIDDKLANYDALEAAGVNAWLFDRPWNQDSTRVRNRVRSMKDFAGIIGLLTHYQKVSLHV